MVGVGLICLSGCGPDRPATIAVDGTVTLDGEAVEGASVTFIPGGEGKIAMGTTDSSGKFTLTTYEPGDGAIAGTHKVTVRKTAGQEGGASSDTSAEGEDEPEGDFMGDDGSSEGAEEWITPQKYSNPATTDLTVEVKSGMEPVTLQLTSQ
jgi:hypothetical protein